MILLSVFTQIFIAISIAVVWVFRFENIVKEFEQYGISPLIRSIVGATKISLATLLVVGIWHPELVVIPALTMALLMLAAQYFHLKVKNPLIKFVPSFILLLLSLFVAGVGSGYLR
ncbi:MAG: DoxX family protein [Leptospira sp.]|nr:DoxX family protein [Leptospira sp.]